MTIVEFRVSIFQFRFSAFAASFSPFDLQLSTLDFRFPPSHFTLYTLSDIRSFGHLELIQVLFAHPNHHLTSNCCGRFLQSPAPFLQRSQALKGPFREARCPPCAPPAKCKPRFTKSAEEPILPRHKPTLTRRLVAYFCSAAYTFSIPISFASAIGSASCKESEIRIRRAKPPCRTR